MSMASPVDSAAAAPAEAAIAVRDLSFAYGLRQALKSVSFSIARGEIFAFLGPNGGGKTTLFKLLSTLLSSQQGEVRMLGRDLAGETIEARCLLGVVFQHPSLDGKLTVRENLLHHGHLYGLSGELLAARIDAMLSQLGLAARAGELVETLSGGLQRRTELAKALLHQPRLLLLDEPSTGLDPGARREFNGYLLHLRDREGVTVVLTTHYMEEAEMCDRVAILDEGRIVALAPPAELKARIGGDVVVLRGTNNETLLRRINQRFGLEGKPVDGTIRLERRDGHHLVSEIVDAFGPEIESVTFGKPTLEDVFVHVTGHRFFDGPGERDA